MLFKELIACFIATVFFAHIFGAPPKSIKVSSMVATLGYSLFWVFSHLLHQELIGCVVATLLMAILSEACARKMKMPVTVFITVAIIPLAPGIGLYRTMLFFVQDEFAMAAQQGVDTLLRAGGMAMAIAVGTLLTKGWCKRIHL